MTVSNEIKAKVFAQYLGQRFVHRVHGPGASGARLEAVYLDGILCAGFDRQYHVDCHVLKLRPLSAITDEDAIEVSKICGYKHDQNKWGRFVAQNFVQQREDALTHTLVVSASIYQYLQSKGYDLPSWYLGGKTLHEAGLAIYENEVKP